MAEGFEKYMKNLKAHKSSNISKDEAMVLFRGTTQGILIGMAGGLMLFYFKKWNLVAGGLLGAMAGGFITRTIMKR